MIKVMAGDISEGKWDFTSIFGQATMSRWGDTIDLKKELDSVEALTEEKVKKLLATAGWTVAGALLLGPLGALGGLLFGGNKKEVCFAAQLKDGRKFMAVTDSNTWKKLLAITFK